MATWEDGPEYAPRLRPDQFQAPGQVPELTVAEPPHRPSSGAPLQPPAGFEMPQQVAPLASLVPTEKDPRDPRLAFQVASATMTSQAATGPAAWNAAHSSSWAPPEGQPAAVAGPPVHDPRQPFTVGPAAAPAPPAPAGPVMPAPGTDQWFAPTSWAPPQQPADDRTLMRKVLDGATIPVMITLAIGLIPMLAPFCMVIAFVLTRMVPRRRAQLRIAYLIGFGVLLLSGLGGLVNSFSWSGTVSALQPPAALFCLVMLFVSPVISYLSVNAGEREEQPQGSTRGSSSWG